MSKFTSIGQFRDVVRHVRYQAQFKGLDDEGNPIMDSAAAVPTVNAIGTVKLHGTNAGVKKLENDELEVWSRTRVITPEKDNYGFAQFVSEREQWFKDVLNAGEIMYGEWCGEGIQKGVAISELPRMFVIFAIKSVDEEETWLRSQIGHESCPEKNIFNIYDFGAYSLTIDFNHPELAQNKMVEITEQVEAECPVGKYFGVSGVGEGVVWHLTGAQYQKDSGGWWKVKGEKHSVTKVKKLAAVDPERLASAQEFVLNTVTDNRLFQGVEMLQLNGRPLDKSSTGHFLKWVFSDIMKEEQDTLVTSGLGPKDVSGPVQQVARKWYFAYLDQLDA